MKYYVVDAFADRVFAGNAAGVCLVDAPLDADTMQHIAAENNLSETAFVTREKEGYGLRWFTPELEVDLCGHATLASACVLSRFVDEAAESFCFNTQSGLLTVSKKGELFELDFPARMPAERTLTDLMREAVGAPVLEAWQSRDLVLLLPSEAAVRDLQPDMDLLGQIPDCFAVAVTAKGDEVDFVSRFFGPNIGVPEDPVTGSVHSTLIPFWAGRLDKQQMVARQLSARGGTLYCENHGERVKIAGKAALYLAGEIFV